MLVVRNPRNVYRYVRQALEAGNKVSYLTTLPNGELVAHLSKYWSGVGKHLTSGQLLIQSAYDHFPREGHAITTQESRVRSARSFEPVREAIVVICPAAVTEYVKTCLHTSRLASVPSESKVDSIMKFEITVGEQFSNATVVCCLFDRLLQDIDLVPLLNLLRNHKITIRPDGEMTPLSDHGVINAISRGIDAILGRGSSFLVMKTLFHIYNIDEVAILREPDVWCAKLTKLCGEYNANLILIAAAGEIRKLVMQRTPYVSEA